jgi:hypothetical protein
MCLSLLRLFSQSKKFVGNVGSKKQSQNKLSEKTSPLILEAVGDDTRFNRDPTVWTNTIADPSLWRIFNYYTMKKMAVNMSK